MARATKSNGFGQAPGFLSDLVKGDVTVETSDRVWTADGEWATYGEGSGGVRPYKEWGDGTMKRGARSGHAKTLTVK